MKVFNCYYIYYYLAFPQIPLTLFKKNLVDERNGGGFKREQKDEQKTVKCELLHAQEELKRIQSVPLVIGQKQNNVGSNYYARILNTINRELLKPSAFVVLHCHSNVLVDMATLHDDFPHGGGVGALHRDSIDHLLPVGGLEVGAVGVDEGRMAEGDAGKGRGRRREVGNHFIFLK